jgi:hypothetical protein
MMRLASVFLLATAVWALNSEKPRVMRAMVTAQEKSFDERLRTANVADPFDLLGNTRGVYLEGYGVVFTTEVNLVVTPQLMFGPFGPPAPAKKDTDKMHARKVERLPLLKQKMRDMLISAASLDGVRPQEQVVVGVSLFYLNWEDKTNLPAQILMQVERQKILDYQAGRIAEKQLDGLIRMQEF